MRLLNRLVSQSLVEQPFGWPELTAGAEPIRGLPLPRQLMRRYAPCGFPKQPLRHW